jgi:HSP90 family molecular chaperone
MRPTPPKSFGTIKSHKKMPTSLMLISTLKFKSLPTKNAGEITIRDFGIGMTRDELIENLGTIAHSGSKAFLTALKESGERNDNLIGQFGVGFYSVFMVADSVKVYTRTWQAEGEGYCWSSDGSGAYEIEQVEGERRGTRIVISLKDEYKGLCEEGSSRRNHQKIFCLRAIPRFGGRREAQHHRRDLAQK